MNERKVGFIGLCIIFILCVYLNVFGARLPIPGYDDDVWATILNEYLLVSHQADGTLEIGIVDATNIDQSDAFDISSTILVYQKDLVYIKTESEARFIDHSSVETLSYKTAESFTINSSIINTSTLNMPTINTPVISGGEAISFTVNGFTLNSTISGTAFLDEDSMVSDSATKAASQQSIKAYIDTSLADGTYIPSSTAVLNISAISSEAGMYTRIGNTVHAAIYARIDPVASGTITTATFTLPVSSNLTNKEDLIGTGTFEANSGSTNDSVQVYAYTSTNQAAAVFWPSITNVDDIFLQFTYQVK